MKIAIKTVHAITFVGIYRDFQLFNHAVMHFKEIVSRHQRINKKQHQKYRDAKQGDIGG